MSKTAVEILLLVFYAGGYFLSWRFYTKEKYTPAVWLLILCGLALRLAAASDPCLHEWDERYHALVAKNFRI